MGYLAAGGLASCRCFIESKMGTSATHYVVYGIAITDKVVSQILDLDCGVLDQYYDNPYKSEVTNGNDIHIICDGMSGEYVVIGKIVSKAIESEGFDLKVLKPEEDSLDIYKKIREIESKFGVTFNTDKIGFIIFTHWY